MKSSSTSASPTHSDVSAGTRLTRRSRYRLFRMRTAVLPVLVGIALITLTAWNVTRSNSLSEARAAYNRRDLAGCLRHSLAHLRHRPWSREAALLAARCFSQLDYADEAEHYFRRAGRLSLDDAHWHAFGLARANRHAQAIQAYREILARWPDNVVALRRLAAVQLAMQDRAETLKLAERLIKIPRAEAIGYTLRGVVHHNAEDREEAVAAYERVLQLDPELSDMPLPRRMFWGELADDLVALGRIGEARSYLRRAFAATPDAFLLKMLGRAARLEGDVEDAERCFRQAAQLDPRDAFAHVHLGQLAMQRRQFEAALDELKNALRLDPRHYQAAYNLALSLRQLGRVEEAERYEQIAADLRHESSSSATAVRRGPLPRYAL